MRSIDNPQEFRSNICAKLRILLDGGLSEQSVENMEKSIYNYCIKDAGARNIVKKWDNPFFVQLYLDRLRSIYLNIKQSPEFKQKLLSKEIKAHEMGCLTHQDMAPAKWQRLIEEKKVRDENKYTPKLEASTDNFTCRKCKSKKCSYYQLQTRSADEPMTTFVTCLDCGSRWKC
jgi:DNA-directed RNA polymerase subunit M/transcription elongation factor TFIIS